MARLIQRSYVLSRVFARRDKIIRLAANLAGKELDEELFAELTRAFSKVLPHNIEPDIIRESLLHLAGRKLSSQDLFDNAWRLAGNVDRLQLYHSVPPWNRQIADEYVPVTVTAVMLQDRDRRIWAELSLRVMAGTPTPLVLKKNWSAKFCAMLSRQFGFSPPWDDSRRFESPMQLVGLQWYVLVEQRLCGATPDFERLWTDDRTERIRPAAALEHNRQLLNLRNRVVSKFACVAGFKDDFPCHKCYVGLDRCPLAVHDYTHVKQNCHHCHRESLFDPQLSTRMCISCYKRHLKGEL